MRSSDRQPTVAILGAGTMGRRIAYDTALHGCETRLFDIVPSAGESALGWIAHQLREREGAEELPWGTTASSMRCVSLASSVEELARGADFIFENVPEQFAVKSAALGALDPHIGPHAVVVSNTSSMPGSLLLGALTHGDRFINANFGHLGHRKVEVMPNHATSAETRDRTVALLRSLGFVPIVLEREHFGYASNRVWRAVKKEVLTLIDAGIISARDIDRAWMLDWEVPLGPCALMDRIGLDVVRDIELSYYRASGNPVDLPPPFLDRMVADGKLGVKSGEGFYRYPGPAFEEAGFLDEETRDE
ncbi:MAG: 3-hydroxyacyl-CoA dehydrogenase family protein [Gemmatimonadaceae bacterium]